MAPSDEKDFPPPVELEKWMMNTAKEKDRGAAFLRRMLRMNPAYGQHLAEDEDLTEIVQVFAKRFRQVISGAEFPLKPATLYKPLCEVIWRVVGHVLSSLFEFTDGQNNDLPVPKQATGQVKMLLQSNIDLSNKLKEARRTYLIELTEHRDKQRHLSEQVQRAVESLREQPVMFYEPLEYVLDETTKDFVRLVVEERLKLEMRAGYKTDEANAEMAGYMHDLEVKIVKKEAELKQLRMTAAKAEKDRREAVEAMADAKQEAVKARDAAEKSLEEFDEMASKVSNMEWEVTQQKRRNAILERDSSSNDEKSAEMKSQIQQMEAQDEKMRALQEQVMKLQMENKKQKAEVAAVAAKAAAAEEAISAAAPGAAATATAAAAAAAAAGADETATKAEGGQSGKASAGSAGKDTETIIEKEGNETIIEKDGKENVQVVEKVVEKIVYVNEAAVQEEKEQLVASHMQVEKELRDALTALQGQLGEEQAHSKRLTETMVELGFEVEDHKKGKKRKTRKAKASADEETEEDEEVEKKEKAMVPDDRDVEKAIKKVSAQFEKQVQELQAEVARLEAELEAVNGEGDTSVEYVEQKHKKKKVKQVEETPEEPQEKGGKWKRKYDELEVQYGDLEDEYTKLEQKVTGLLDKLKEKMSDDEVQETLTRIKLAPPPPKKKRKKKAYERLYDDAQKRLVDMKIRHEKALKAELQVLSDAAQKVKDRRSLRAVEALVHLQKAASSTSLRFHDAVSKFQEQHPDDPTAQHAPDGSMSMNTTIPEDASPEWVAAMARQHYASQQRQSQIYRPAHGQAHHPEEAHRNSQMIGMWSRSGSRGRAVSRSLSTPPGRVSSSSPELGGDTPVNQMHEMPFAPQYSGPGVSNLMSPHYAMSAGYSGTPGQPAERITSPMGSTSSVSPATRRRTYGGQAIAQSGLGGPSASRPGPINVGYRGSNPAMPRSSLSHAQNSSWQTSGRQSSAQIASMQSARQSVVQIDATRGSVVHIDAVRGSSARRGTNFPDDGKDLISYRAAEAAGSMALDVAEAPRIAGRHPSLAGDPGGLRPSEEFLLQAAPPGIAPVSPSPPGFSTRLGNESGRRVHGSLDPMSRGPLSPGSRRSEDIFSDRMKGQKLSNSWGGRFSRSTPDLTVMAQSYHQDDVRSPGWEPMHKGKTRQKKGSVAMYGTTVLGQSS
mmetsp:Transcript_64059/g.111651  ORF Transcript_64059/g.111651 Transcript_64059/m.111651 type:complete len:1175 (+) Transcript_64059:78-3602(+)